MFEETTHQRYRFQIAVLSDGGHADSGNNSTINSWDKIKLCGADFCVLGNGGHENLERPPESEIYEIPAIYLTCVIIAVIIVALFVDPLSRWVPNIWEQKSSVRNVLIENSSFPQTIAYQYQSHRNSLRNRIVRRTSKNRPVIEKC